MADLTPKIADEVIAACTAEPQELAGAFTRAFGAEFEISVGQAGSLDINALPEEFSGPGLAVVFTIGSEGALVLLPESTALVPPWCAEPDPTGESKLATLAQELGMLVLPEQFMPDDSKTGSVKNLAGALRRGGVADGAGMVPLELSADGKQGTAHIIWPIPQPAAVVGSAVAKPKPAAKSPPKAAPKAAPKRHKRRLKDLPDYTRSLLRVKVPLVVTLAEKRQPLGRIVELGPGSIIQFEKSCEEMLELDVGSRPVAIGEAVKVGDKFGLRITSVTLPEERFNVVKSKTTKQE